MCNCLVLHAEYGILGSIYIRELSPQLPPTQFAGEEESGILWGFGLWFLSLHVSHSSPIRFNLGAGF